MSSAVVSEPVAKPKITVTTEDVVKNASDDEVLYLLRGSRMVSAAKMKEKGCARGDVADANCGRPTEQEATSQVGGSKAGESLTEHKKFPEFTTSMFWAQSYATDCIVLVAIQKKYLTKGSGSEDGWICYDAAPCKLMGSQPYKPDVAKSLVNSKTGKKMIAD